MVVNRWNASLLRLICFLIGAAVVISIGACRSGVPVLDTSPKPTHADGTISGTVRGPEGTSPIENREVAVVNVDTGERQRVTTNPAGGFSFKLKPGKYRVEIALMQGEALVKKPGVITVSIGKPMSPRDGDANELMERVEKWIETEMRVISPAVYTSSPPIESREAASSTVA